MALDSPGPGLGVPATPPGVELPKTASPSEVGRLAAEGPVVDDLEMELGHGVELESFVGRPANGIGGVPFEFGEEPDEAGADRPPEFGKYQMLGELGRGGMGVVYMARHKELNRIVAIKMILSSHLASPEHVERFYAEARAAAKVLSPNIVAIHDVGQYRGQHYFEMDYVAGPSLAKIIKQGPLDPHDAARYVQVVARAVAHLHEEGIVHRDLKPSNVLLDEEGRPHVTDFGLAKMLQSDGGMTRSGAIVGTPGYMAPEQAAGRVGQVGPRSDVYSLGAILFELLTGRPPFTGETPLDTLVQVLESEPPRPGRLRKGIPKALEIICLKCLEREPEGRYLTAESLADDLDHFLRGEPIGARSEGLWDRVRRWARREPALASRLGTIGLVGAIIQANHYLIANAPPGPRRAITVVVLWAGVSILCQVLMNRTRWGDLVRYAWAAADVVLFTLLVRIHDGLTTSLVSGYFLLIAASGLWFREHLVWVTTGMAVAAYGSLVLHTGLASAAMLESPYRHVVFVSVLTISGVITGYQVRRVRALSQYYETRPLP